MLSDLLPIVSGVAIGFSIGHLSGAINNAFFISYFEHPSEGVMEVLVGTLFGCAAFGSILGGQLADAFGRRRALISGAVLLTVGFAVQALPLLCSTSMAFLFLSRAIIGLGLGALHSSVILYVAETAPLSDRGSQEAILSTGIATGCFVVYTLSYMVLPTHLSGWKVCLAAGSPPALLVLLVACTLPESPRWLALRGDLEGARGELGKLRIACDLRLVEEELRVIASTCKAEPALGYLAAANLFTQHRPAIALAMMAWSVLTGIDIITQYAAQIFGDGSMEESQNLMYSVWMGLTMVLSSLIPIFTIDTLGRRPLLITGAVCLVGSLVCLAIVHAPVLSGRVNIMLQVVPVLTFISGFSIMVPVFLVLPTEVLETRSRAKIIAISWAVVWSADHLVTSSFLSLRQALGLSGAFVVYIVINLLFGTLMWRHAPETLGCELDAECTKDLVVAEKA